MNNKTVYIAGKVSKPSYFRFKTLWKYYVITKFKIVEIYLIFLGYEVINPVSAIGWNVTWDEAMNICLNRLILAADYCYFMYDWRWSKGAREELKHAAKLKKLVLNGGMANRFYWTHYIEFHVSSKKINNSRLMELLKEVKLIKKAV